jgi:hypothetical protein
MRKMSSRNSLLAHLLPERVRCRESHFQYNLDPPRCHAATVSGWTRINRAGRPTCSVPLQDSPETKERALPITGSALCVSNPGELLGPLFAAFGGLLLGHGLLHLLAPLGARFGTLLAFLVEDLLGADQLDDGLFAAVALAEAGAGDAQIDAALKSSQPHAAPADKPPVLRIRPFSTRHLPAVNLR